MMHSYNLHLTRYSAIDDVLILVVMDDALVLAPMFPDVARNTVLILVVMDDALVRTKQDFWPEQSKMS